MTLIINIYIYFVQLIKILFPARSAEAIFTIRCYFCSTYLFYSIGSKIMNANFLQFIHLYPVVNSFTSFTLLKSSAVSKRHAWRSPTKMKSQCLNYYSYCVTSCCFSLGVVHHYRHTRKLMEEVKEGRMLNLETESGEKVAHIALYESCHATPDNCFIYAAIIMTFCCNTVLFYKTAIRTSDATQLPLVLLQLMIYF